MPAALQTSYAVCRGTPPSSSDSSSSPPALGRGAGPAAGPAGVVPRARRAEPEPGPARRGTEGTVVGAVPSVTAWVSEDSAASAASRGSAAPSSPDSLRAIVLRAPALVALNELE